MVFMNTVEKILYKILVYQIKQHKVGFSPSQESKNDNIHIYHFNKIKSYDHFSTDLKKHVIKFSIYLYFKLLTNN